MIQSLILCCTLFQAIFLNAADDRLSYGQDGVIISVLLKKISDLEERDRVFDKRLEAINVLQKRLDEAQKRLTNMQKVEYRLQKAEERIRMLVNRVENNNANCIMNKSDSMKVFDDKRTLDNMNHSSSGSVSNIESRQAEMNDKIAEIESNKNHFDMADAAHTKIIRMASAQKVAFSVRFSSGPITLVIGHPLLFDAIEINEGNGYNKVTGIFTCPISGTYFFYTNIICSGSQTIEAETELVLDGVVKASTLAYNPDHYDQGSASAIVHCRAGQMVWIRTHSGSLIYGYSFTSFSGFLLWEDADAVNSN